MADDVQITAGTGTTIATDDVGSGRQVQVIKIALGADGALDTLVDSGQQTMANSLPVALASNQSALPVTDNAGSITVDAPTGTPVNVQIGNATLTVGVIDETGSGAVDALAVGGGTAHDAVDSGNPQKQGFKAKNVLPTAVANNDRADGISDLFGRQMISFIDPAQFQHRAFNATSTQTGTDVWDPGSSARIAITSIVIGCYATTAARIILWFGDNADTTYTAGTDQLVLAFSAAPSTTSKPGLVFTPATPIFCTTADRELHITTDAAISIDVACHGYEW